MASRQQVEKNEHLLLTNQENDDLDTRNARRLETQCHMFGYIAESIF